MGCLNKDGQYSLTEKTVDSFLHGCPQEPQTHHSPKPSKSRLPNTTLSSEEVAKVIEMYHSVDF